jgi:Tol biopolymer transport system component/DNA-binding winged helix-turn-helix (wHTH) protein
MHRLHLGDFTVDPAAGEVEGPAGREQLDPKVMQVLLVLAQQAGSVVTRQELLEKVWPGVVVGDDVVSRCIYQLRRHLRQAGGDERHAAMVETLPKRGYRLNCGHADEQPALPEAAPEGAQVDPADTQVPATDARRSRPRGRWLLAAGAAVVLAATVAGVAFFQQEGDPWQDPLADARFTRITDSEGVVPGVAMSRDGSLIAYLARLNGRVDAWITQAGTGRFRNLTQGRVPEIDNPARTLGFTPDASQVTTWTRILDPNGKELIHTWVVASAGGQPHPYVVENASEVAWSPDGTQLVYHPAAPGDPLFVASVDGTARRQIHVASYGVHCHFPIWSPDGRSIYFVQGHPPDKMDLWRIAVDGGKPERLTFHDSRVSYPVFLDAMTLLYLATAEDGSGPWLYGLDMRSRIPHRIALGLEQYTSLAASANGRRLVATRTTLRTSLWRIPVMERVANETDAERIPLPASGGRMPRLGPGYLLFVSGDGGGMRRLAAHDNALTELWNGKGSRLVAGPAIDPASQRIAFPAARDGRTRLQVMNADGSGLHTLAPDLEVEGAPTWSPGGDAIQIAAEQGQDTRLFEVPLDGARIVPITADHSRDATWSPDGSFLVYNGAEIGPQFHVRAMSADGRPHALPDIALPRGARRLVFLSGSNRLVVLKGDARDRNFWLVDLDTGKERQLTDFDSGFAIDNFDVSADGREIVFDQLREESDVVQIDLARR